MKYRGIKGGRKMKFFTKVVPVFAILMFIFAGGAYAADNYNPEDLAVLRAIKSDNPGVLADLDLDNPTIEEVVIDAEDIGQFPPFVKAGDVVKVWIRPGDSLDESENFIGWIQVDGIWRIMYVAGEGAGLLSFNASKLTDLPYLGNLSLSEFARIELPALPLHALEIEGNTVDVDVSKLADLVAFRVTRTNVTKLTLPPSSKLEYFTCTMNTALTELTGLYGYDKELKPFPGNNNVFYGNHPDLHQHTITITPSQNGMITKNGGDTIYNGDSVTFTVQANSGYKLDTFQINGTPATLTGNTYTHKAANNVTAAATFAKGTDETLPPDSNNSGGGGCDAGIGGLAVLLVGALAVFLKKRV